MVGSTLQEREGMPSLFFKIVKGPFNSWEVFFPNHKILMDAKSK
jgi:hypothetical protein